MAMSKTLKRTLKADVLTKLPTCHEEASETMKGHTAIASRCAGKGTFKAYLQQARSVRLKSVEKMGWER